MFDTLTVDSFGNSSELARPGPQAASTLSSPESWFVRWATGNPGGDQGPVVNEFTAFNYLTVYDCVSLIATKIAEMPLVTYYGDPYYGETREREPATDRSEFKLLLSEYNPRMSAFTAREAGVAHLLTWGNSFTQIVWNKLRTEVLELVPLGPDVTSPTMTASGELVYEVYQRGTGKLLAELEPADVLHVPGLSFDGLLGYSPIRIAKTAIRAGIGQDSEAEKFISRGIRPPGAVKFPVGRKFRDEQQAIQYRENFRKIHSTADGALNVVILEDGAEWQELGVDPESAQLLESRRYSRNEICGLYRVPPFLVGGIETSTSWGTGIAEQKQGFVDYCLMGWIRRIEAELKRKLAKDDPDVYYRHCVEELLRGDILKRTQAREIQHRRGIITDNEWRIDENMNPVEGGDVRHYPLNEGRIDDEGDDLETGPGDPKPSPFPMVPVPENLPTDTPPEDPEEYQPPSSANYARAIARAAGRCLRKESAEAVKASGRPDRFVSWLDDFYGKHVEMVRDHTGDLVGLWAELFGGATGYAERHIERSRNELLEAAGVSAKELPASIERVAARWQSERLLDIAAEFNAGGTDSTRPVVNTVVNVSMPAQLAPVVNVTPAAPAAVTVNVPQQSAPVVNVAIPDHPVPVVNVAAPEPPKPGKRKAKKLKDGSWEIEG